jgi:hypothetical protein
MMGNTNGKGNKGKLRSEEAKQKLREINLGKNLSEETKRKIGKALKGHKHSEEMKRKLSDTLRGEKSRLWKGDISTENEKIRKGIDFRLWREAIYARDNWTCQKTGIKGGLLHPHHIQNFAQYPELRFAIDNGITLSKEAHEAFHKKYGKRNNTGEQLQEFLREELLKKDQRQVICCKQKEKQ